MARYGNLAGEYFTGRRKKRLDLACEVIDHYRNKPGLSFVGDGKEWSDSEVAQLVAPYNTHIWICNMMEAQLFVFTYTDLMEIPGIMLDRIRHIQSKQAEIKRGSSE
mgnify:CR=1 FL=1